MITPVILVVGFMKFMSYYNDALEYDRLQKNQGLDNELSQKILKMNDRSGSSDSIDADGDRDGDDEESNNDEDEDEDGDMEEIPKNEVLVLETKLGDIRITMRPDLSPGSVDYIHRLINAGCGRCKLYRAEQRGILQGIMAKKGVTPNDVKGNCPPSADKEDVGECPDWDKNCSCHGPIMTRGAVAWAAGQAGGPDFFIDNYRRPAKWWGTQHTNFGFIEDLNSLAVVDRIFDQPKENRGMTFLKEELHFELRLE